ncbi:glutamate receptor ionotropic, kainate 2-like isoform X2 [Cylas formicarius]|uniref:glutamate receptor ionotropic, kainate 2-like isoform X2 n=1 Tax=Cylas formicarius TaxID=197179 RepID=UPI00295856D0|nr:glutamate receptor ionotropic, kainate 2-like isoform X2 [Cylas formicarius]
MNLLESCLLLVLVRGFCFAKTSIRVAHYGEDVSTSINWNVLYENIGKDFDLLPPETRIINKRDFLSTTRMLYDSMSQDGKLVAVLGTASVIASSNLESVCSHLCLPYVTVKKRSKNLHSSTFSLYPDSGLLSKAQATIIKSFDWDGFILLYEEDDGLLNLQEVLKLQNYNKDKPKNNILIKQLDPGWDNREVLKSLKNSTIRRIILDCNVERISEILMQAEEVDILSDFSTSIFLTSLDAHTIDFTFLNTLSNITTIRLFNPNEPSFQYRVLAYYPDITPNQIKLETALLHDAMLLIAMLINTVNGDIINQKNYCNSTKKFDQSLELAHKIRISIHDGLTGSQIDLHSGRRNRFNLEIIEVNKPHKPIATWNSKFPDTINLKRNATEREAELQRRLSSHNFIVTSRIGGPYLYQSKEPDAIGNARYYGYSMDLLKEIAILMNISYEFRITEGNLYPNLASDLVERRADLAICDFTITPQRQEIIDFSMPFMNLGIGILHKVSDEIEVDNLYGFLKPLSWAVWFYIWTLNLIISLVMFFVARLAPGEWKSPKPWDPNVKELENIWDIKNFLWLTLGSITTQGCDILPKAPSTRIISAFWWFFSLIISSSYIANMAAFLTMSKNVETIDNVEELGKQSKVKYGLVEGASTAAFFSTSNNSLYQKMWNNMKNEKPSVFEKDNANGVERVLSTKNSLYAFFMESTGIEYELERKCNLRKIGNLLDSKSYGIGMPMNADYRDSINAAVLTLQENGRLGELKEKWWKLERHGNPCPPRFVGRTTQRCTEFGERRGSFYSSSRRHCIRVLPCCIAIPMERAKSFCRRENSIRRNAES